MTQPRRSLSFVGWIAVALLVAPVLTAAALSPSATAAGVGQYGKPEWLPLRHAPAGGELRVGCTLNSGGSICEGNYHPYWALDLAVNQGGTAVFAAGAGQVQVIPDPNSSGYGNYIVINHGSYGRTLYGHLASFSVSNGAWVDENTQIGIVGHTGSTSGTDHLHFESNDNAGGWEAREGRTTRDP